MDYLTTLLPFYGVNDADDTSKFILSLIKSTDLQNPIIVLEKVKKTIEFCGSIDTCVDFSRLFFELTAKFRSCNLCRLFFELYHDQIDVNKQYGNMSQSVLMVATQYSMGETIAMLLENGADFDARDLLHRTAMDIHRQTYSPYNKSEINKLFENAKIKKEQLTLRAKETFDKNVQLEKEIEQLRLKVMTLEEQSDGNVSGDTRRRKIVKTSE